MLRADRRAAGGIDAVALANERSASEGNLEWGGVKINHQFSKSLAVERLLAAAASKAGPGDLLGASPRQRARDRAGVRATPEYHAAFTSCNAIFRIDPELRSASWCRECPKCRFVFLALAPYLDPEALASIFGSDLLADPTQTEGFELLTATGGHKPFECVGEEQESVAALRMIADEPRWASHSVVAAMRQTVLAGLAPDVGEPALVLSLRGEHLIPSNLEPRAREVLGF